MSMCSVSGCNSPTKHKGYCGAHYKRLWRHGNPTEGRTFNGAPDKWVQAHINHKSVDCLVWPFGRDKQGRGFMMVERKPVRVARVMCEARNGPPKKGESAAHSCGNGHLGCVNPAHMSWKTHKGNMQDMVAHGRSTRGEKSAANKLDAETVLLVRKRRDIGPIAMARQLGICHQTVCDIRSRKTWAWL